MIPVVAVLVVVFGWSLVLMCSTGQQTDGLAMKPVLDWADREARAEIEREFSKTSWMSN